MVALVTAAEFRAWGSSRMMAAAEASAHGNNMSGGNCLFQLLVAAAVMSSSKQFLGMNLRISSGSINF